jgi:hypothetical protein
VLSGGGGGSSVGPHISAVFVRSECNGRGHSGMAWKLSAGVQWSSRTPAEVGQICQKRFTIQKMSTCLSLFLVMKLGQ